MSLFQIKLIKEIILLALPISLFNLMTVFIGIANGLMLVKLGSVALASGAMIGIIQISLMMICSSPLFAISSIISRLNAENKTFQIGSIIQQGSVFALLLSIPAILAMIFIKPILHLFGQPDGVVELVNLYFQAYCWGVPTAMLLTCVQQVLLGLKKTRLVTLVGAASLVVSVSFGYILAFGKMGFAPQGVSGLGYAQVLRSVIILVTLFLVLNKEFSAFGLYTKWSINKILELKQIFKLGWPISIHAASEYLAIFGITLIIGGLGQTELIAQQIATQYMQLLSIAMLSLSQASNLLVSGGVGKRDWESMQNYGYQGVLLGISISLIAILGFAVFTNVLVSPYLNISENVDLLL
ncbi:MAG: MATE family efflux transporter, partial [Candidatus Thioglobus sp.]